MAKYDVTLKDGRSVLVYADDEAGALKQARHEETSRIQSEIHSRLNKPLGPSFQEPVSATKLKD